MSLKMHRYTDILNSSSFLKGINDNKSACNLGTSATYKTKLFQNS